ncbi:MAG: PorP/SprF family type IX secretion system membrane protein [Saprospiraceae bacterium]|nr:PorP/SprF family type IX secretion system membrane protein [Saprospiraceae bacterium]
MSKSYLSIIVFLGILHSTFAQVSDEWPDEPFMASIINPAQATDLPSLTFIASHSRRFRNLKSSPTQSHLSVIMPWHDQKMALSAHVFSEKIGPLNQNGFDLSYAYRIKTALFQNDFMSMGLTLRMTELRFNHDHLLATQEDDLLLDDMPSEGIMPPSMRVGFSYESGLPDLANPVQFRLGIVASHFLPFEDRFNAFGFARVFSWHARFGLNAFASDQITVEPEILISASNGLPSNFILRIQTIHQDLGWIMTQYSKTGILTLQLGLNLGSINSKSIRLSINNSWYLGTLNANLGNSLGLGFLYSKE